MTLSDPCSRPELNDKLYFPWAYQPAFLIQFNSVFFLLEDSINTWSMFLCNGFLYFFAVNVLS